MKMQVMLGKPQPWVLPVTFVCLAIGALIALMMKASLGAPDIDRNARPEELRSMIRNLQTEKNDLMEENKNLRKIPAEAKQLLTHASCSYYTGF